MENDDTKNLLKMGAGSISHRHPPDKISSKPFLNSNNRSDFTNLASKILINSSTAQIKYD